MKAIRRREEVGFLWPTQRDLCRRDLAEIAIESTRPVQSETCAPILQFDRVAFYALSLCDRLVDQLAKVHVQALHEPRVLLERLFVTKIG
jgi:hypothetical protein